MQNATGEFSYAVCRSETWTVRTQNEVTLRTDGWRLFCNENQFHETTSASAEQQWFWRCTNKRKRIGIS